VLCLFSAEIIIKIKIEKKSLHFILEKKNNNKINKLELPKIT